MRIKDWNKFQHFKDRKPTWIKLYRCILDDIEWFNLSDEASKCLIMLWLIASEKDGYLPDIKVISFRIRKDIYDTKRILSQLDHYIIFEDGDDIKTPINSTLYQDDIKLISEPYQNDILEKRREEKEYCASGDAPKTFLSSKGKKLEGKRKVTFEQFWEAFDYKKGKASAADSWLKIPKLTDAIVSDIIKAAKAEAKRRPSLIENGTTPKMAQGWLTERRWEDEYQPVKEAWEV